MAYFMVPTFSCVLNFFFTCKALFMIFRIQIFFTRNGQELNLDEIRRKNIFFFVFFQVGIIFMIQTSQEMILNPYLSLVSSGLIWVP